MITILTVGETKDLHICALIQEYLKRLSSEKIILHAVKGEKNKDPDVVKKKEGERLLDKIKESDFVIALSEEGKMMNSFSFAEFLGRKQMEKNMVFILGGAYGSHEDVKRRAQVILSLSPMTLPHEIAFLLLIEQIYRAYTLKNKSPYHK